MYLIDRKYLEVDIRHMRWNMVSFAIAFGCNSFIGGKINNLFLEIDFLFWVFGIELKFHRKQKGEEKR